MDSERKLKWDMRFLHLAKHVSSWSKDPSTKVGCVITEGNRVIQLGYNGFARGIQDLPERLNNREIKYKIILHAEENALALASRSVEGCTVYTWPMLPCAHCAALLIQHGIKRVISIENQEPRWTDSIVLSCRQFIEAEVEWYAYSNLLDG